MGHPWAKNPTTIGSIATMYLSILFMRYLVEEEDGYQQQEEIIKRNLELLQELEGNKILLQNLQHQVTILQLGPR
jgi:hypothetical protein